MNDIIILNNEHPNFKRLYWSTDKNRIKEIMSRVNAKYLKGLLRHFRNFPFEEYYHINSNDLRLFLRYDGCQFTVTHQTIIKELYKRGM